jgi:hypothetical protein
MIGPPQGDEWPQVEGRVTEARRAIAAQSEEERG